MLMLDLAPAYSLVLISGLFTGIILAVVVILGAIFSRDLKRDNRHK